MNYKKIARIAADLEQQVIGDDKSFVDGLDERTKKEQEAVDAPTPSLEAGKFDTETNVQCSEDKRVASLKKLTRLAHRVRNSSMTASEKRIAMRKIAKAREAIDFDDDGDFSGVTEEPEIINKQMLSQQNKGNNRSKVMQIYSNLNKLKEIKPTTKLMELNVKLPIQVSQLTVRQLLNIVNDIADQAGTGADMAASEE